MVATRQLLLLAVLAVSAMGCGDNAEARQGEDLRGRPGAVVADHLGDERSEPADGPAIPDTEDEPGADVVEETHDIDDPVPNGETSPCSDGRIDINAAAPHELERIVHIGPARAAQLEELRPFSNLRDLTRVAGIANRRLTDIVDQGLACVVEAAPEGPRPSSEELRSRP